MLEVTTLARVILRPDGIVHIAFQGARSIYATAENLSQLFSDPIDFIETGSHQYKSSAIEINRKRVALVDVLGLTLATVNSDKQVICDFPELFQYLFSANQSEKQRTAPLNMKSFELETVLSDEKSYLLRYYMELTNYFKITPTIKKNIKLRDQIQTEILREILNTFFAEDLPEPAKDVTLSEKIEQIESDNLLKQGSLTKGTDMITVDDYAKKIGITPQTVRLYLRDGRLKTAIKNKQGHWLINKNDIPEEWNMRKGRKRQHKTDGQFYRRKKTGSAADVAEHIIKTKLFTPEVAQYIHTFEEMDYYIKHSYHEVRLDGKMGLIIDINPDYVSTKTGLSNRQMILNGDAPVVPDPIKEAPYHIHHVGQHSTSPFAIIPEYDHNSFDKILHPGKPDKDLHGPDFELEKNSFWLSYLEAYDEAGVFWKIPYLNPKTGRYK